MYKYIGGWARPIVTYRSLPNNSLVRAKQRLEMASGGSLSRVYATCSMGSFLLYFGTLHDVLLHSPHERCPLISPTSSPLPFPSLCSLSLTPQLSPLLPSKVNNEVLGSDGKAQERSVVLLLHRETIEWGSTLSTPVLEGSPLRF